MILTHYALNFFDTPISSDDLLPSFIGTEKEIINLKARLIFDIELINKVCEKSTRTTCLLDKDGESIHKINFDYLQIHACALLWRLKKLKSEVAMDYPIEAIIKTLYILVIKFHLEDKEVELLDSIDFLVYHLNIKNYKYAEKEILHHLDYNLYIGLIKSTIPQLTLKDLDGTPWVKKTNVLAKVDYYYYALTQRTVTCFSDMDNFMVSAISILNRKLSHEDQLFSALNNIISLKKKKLPDFKSVSIADIKLIDPALDIYKKIFEQKIFLSRSNSSYHNSLLTSNFSSIRHLLRYAVALRDVHGVETILKTFSKVHYYFRSLEIIFNHHPNGNHILHYACFYFHEDIFNLLTSKMTGSHLLAAIHSNPEVDLYQIAGYVDNPEVFSILTEKIGIEECFIKTKGGFSDAIDCIGSTIKNPLKNPADLTSSTESLKEAEEKNDRTKDTLIFSKERHIPPKKRRHKS